MLNDFEARLSKLADERPELFEDDGEAVLLDARAGPPPRFDRGVPVAPPRGGHVAPKRAPPPPRRAEDDATAGSVRLVEQSVDVGGVRATWQMPARLTESETTLELRRQVRASFGE